MALSFVAEIVSSSLKDYFILTWEGLKSNEIVSKVVPAEEGAEDAEAVAVIAVLVDEEAAAVDHPPINEEVDLIHALWEITRFDLNYVIKTHQMMMMIMAVVICY